MAHLEFPDSDRAQHELTDSLIVGRSDVHAQLVIEDKRLSRKHCSFTHDDRGWSVEDLGSANGVKVNGTKITEPALLKDGDSLSLGGIQIRFLDTPEAESPEETALELESEFDLEVSDDDVDVAPAAEAPEILATLKMTRGSLNRVRHPIASLPFLVGRREGCELVLSDDKQASGKHARFERRDDDTIAIVDLNSTNGIKVNGTSTREAILKEGDRITIGSQSFAFYYGEGHDDDELDLDDQHEELSLEDSHVDEAPVGPAIEKQSDAELEEQNRAELQALQHTRVGEDGKSSARMVFRVVEVLVGLGALALVAFLVMQVMQDAAQESLAPGESGEALVQAKPLGPATLISDDTRSFEGEATGSLPPGWALKPGWASDLDSVGVFPDAGVGGKQVLQISRLGLSTDRTVVQRRALIDLQRQSALTFSAHVRAEGAAAAAFLELAWFDSAAASAPFRVDSRAFTVPGADWGKISGVFRVPSGARALRLGVGVAGGTRGSEAMIRFDELALESVDAPAFPSLTASSVSLQRSAGVGLSIARVATEAEALDGQQSLDLMKRGRFSFASEGGARIFHDEWLVSEASGTENSLEWQVFDPDAMAPRKVTLSVEGDRLTLATEQRVATTFSRLRFDALATPELMPAEIAVKAGDGFNRWTSSLEPYNAARESVFTECEGRYLLTCEGSVGVQDRVLTLESGASSMAFSLSYKDTSGTIRELKDRALGRNGEAIAERLAAALEIATRYVTSSATLSFAAERVESLVNEYRIRQFELASQIEEGGSSYASADLFVRATDDLLALRNELSSAMETLQKGRRPLRMIRQASSSTIPQRTLRHLALIDDAIGDLNAIDQRFEALAKRGEAQAFRLRVRRQYYDAESAFQSARDHYASGEFVQARLKFLSVIKRFARSPQSSQARWHLLLLAEDAIASAEHWQSEGLSQIASEKRALSTELIDRVEASLIGTNMGALDLFFSRLKDVDWYSVAELDEWKALENSVLSRIESLRTQLKGGK